MNEKLSSILDEHFNNTPLLFIKTFSSKEHKDEFLNGEIFSNTFDYFVKEEKNGKGRGDSFEGINALSNVDLEFWNSKTNEVFFKSSVGEYGLKTKINDTEKMHLFCVTGVYPDWFDIVNKVDDHTFDCKLSIPEKFLNEMKSNFGNEVAVFSQKEFIESLDDYGNKNKQIINHGKVTYLNYSTNPKERITAHIENKIEFYFQKDIFFDGQSEYRFVFPDLISNKPEIIDLEKKINHLTGIDTFEDLINNPYIMTIKFK